MANDTHYFGHLCRVSRALGTALKKNELLTLIIDTAVDALNARAACLFLADKDPEVFTPAARKGLSENYLHAAPEIVKKHIDEMATAGYLAVDDVAGDPRVENREAQKDEKIVSMLMAPVMAHDRLIGVLALYTAEQRAFSEADIAFLKALADQGGMAVDRARLIEHIRKNTRLFYDLSAGMNASLDVKQIMATLTVDLARAFNAKGVTVHLIDTDGKTLRSVSSHGLGPAFLETLSDGKTGDVGDALNGKTTLIANATDDPDIADRTAYATEGIVTMISAPITSGEAVMGVLRLYFAHRRDFYDDEILMITAFGHQAGLAIKNATCYIQVENELKDLKDDLWSHRSWF